MKIKVLALMAILMVNAGTAFTRTVRVSVPESFKTGQVNWVNLQWPPQASIPVGGSLTVYSRCYESGVTDPAGSDTRLSVWIGYSAANTNPNTWTSWQPAAFNIQYGSADEYQAAIGSTLPAGIWYYASRLQFNGGTYQFGGYNAGGGGFWDGTNNVSGILAVGKTLATIALGNTLQQFDGNPKLVSAITNPAGLATQVTYNGSASPPSATGTYQVLAVISDPVYQGSQTGTLSVYNVPQDPVSAALRDKFIWVAYDQVFNQSDLDMALSCNPDVISRGWFKWGNTGDFNYQPWTWMVQQSAAKNTMFGGGMTVAALYPGEVDDAKFLRIVDRTPLNKPMYLNGDSTLGCYMGDFQKKEYLDFLLSWMYKQIDAGAGTLHLDGIATIPAANTGYSDFSMGEFDKFLMHKYVELNGWSVSDPRWVSVFDISFALDCTDGTVNTFDYRKYLIRKGFAGDPQRFNFPLRKEFGDPSDYQGTYSDKRNRDALQYLYSSVKSYAAGKGTDVLVTMNGYSNYTDYQTMGVWDSWSVTGGRLNISPSFIRHWRDVKEYSMNTLNRDIPLVVFHDWGWGMPFLGEIPPVDQILWLRVYAPEIFASGAIFAWPLSGGGNLYQPVAAVRDTIKRLIGWYSKNRSLYVNSSWNGGKPADLKGQTEMVQATSDQFITPGEQSKRIIHLINKKLNASRNLIARGDFSIRVPSDLRPKSVWAVSPDFTGFQRLDFSYSNGSADVTVKSVDAYTVIVLDYKDSGPQGISTVYAAVPHIEIWPNPGHDFVNIRNNPDRLAPVQVLDLFGNVVLLGDVGADRLDISQLPAGIYFLRFRERAVRMVKE